MKGTCLYPDGRVEEFTLVEVEPGVMETLEVLDNIEGATIHWPALGKPYRVKVNYRVGVL